jgi:hypothetical protein
MNQFLILHKVRGEPQFDVAERTTIGYEDVWVLCTCGHRAYPYRVWPMPAIWSCNIEDTDKHTRHKFHQLITETVVPPDWPDHYASKPEPKLKLNILEIVSKILPKIKRRI